MERNILINGKKYKVKLSKPDKGTHLLAEINGKEYEVGLINNQNYDMPLLIKIGNKSFKVELEKIHRNTPFPIKVNNKLFIAQFEVPNQAPSLQRIEPSLPTIMKRTVRKNTKEIVVSPMPGTIISLKVKQGDFVKEGDVVCILEAMKMENEITAPMDGIIKEIRIKEGSCVDKGEWLVKIKPIHNKSCISHKTKVN
jgi:biotin carboxyl carrier protein